MHGNISDLFMHYRFNPQSHWRVAARCLVATSRLLDARVLRCPAWDNGRGTPVQTLGQVPPETLQLTFAMCQSATFNTGFKGKGTNLFFEIHLSKSHTFRIYKLITNNCSE